MAARQDDLQFRAGSSQPNRSYLSSNTLLIQESSIFHEQCIPKETRDRVKSAPPRSRNVRDYQICNHVMEEMIWDERVKKERVLQKKWDTNNGFLTHYDQYGEEKEKMVAPKEVPSVFKTTGRPLTASKEYGNRLNTSSAKTMQFFERKMMKGFKRNTELTCYD